MLVVSLRQTNTRMNTSKAGYIEVVVQAQG
jgi:hypothetical protein